jgi:hypothetical protein
MQPSQIMKNTKNVNINAKFFYCWYFIATQTCEPGSTFRRECNTCVCSADGTNAVCTLKACLPHNKKRRGMPHEYSNYDHQTKRSVFSSI